MATYLITVLAALLLALIVRKHWINYHVQAYSFKSVYYLWKMGKTPDVAGEMSQLWPMSHMLFELWRWDFSRYIVYQDHYEEMEAFMGNETRLSDAQLLMALADLEARDAEKDAVALTQDDADREDEPPIG